MGQKGQSYYGQRGEFCLAKRVKVEWLFHLFQGLDNMERLIAAMEDTPKSVFHGERFLTDEELSKILRVSRRTLQEYRTLGVVPYYLVQGKALYKESDILKILEDSYKRCKEDMRWV